MILARLIVIAGITIFIYILVWNVLTSDIRKSAKLSVELDGLMDQMTPDEIEEYDEIVAYSLVYTDRENEANAYIDKHKLLNSIKMRMVREVRREMRKAK